MKHIENAQADMELLAPAGSPEILISVIAAGADAVYVGGYKFGARAYATNFDEENLLWAIDYVHMHGKKLYLTVNTLFKNKEINDDLYDYILPLYQAGLDAVLVQDYGVISFLKMHFPDLPIHSSTQMTASSVESAEYFKELGFERVVLSRELSLKEMSTIKNEVGIELETFVHGALCYSYSGMCLFSSILGGRSGNRGRCAQPCRMAYDVYQNNKCIKKNCYILSLKDFCAYEDIHKLKSAGIYSLKIEGRMKQIEYAYGVTSIYSSYLKGESIDSAKKKLEDFGNRGGFTNSYLFKNNDSSMITYQDPSLHKKETSIGKIKENKLSIDGYLSLYKDQEATLTVIWNDESASVSGQIVEAAKNQPMTKEDVDFRMRKTGNTIFEFDHLEISMDKDAFVPNKVLNELRRNALTQLQENYLSKFKRNGQKTRINPSSFENQTTEKYYIASVMNSKQLDAVLKSDFITTVYLNLSTYDKNSMSLSEDIEKSLKAKKRVYLRLPDILRNKDLPMLHSMVNQWKWLGVKGFVVSNSDSFAFARKYKKDFEIIADHGLYSFNNYAVSFLTAEGCNRLTAPIELNKAELAHRNNKNSEIIIYGRYPLMQTANCVCKNTLGCNHTPNELILEDRYKAKFPVLNQCAYCFNTIYNSYPTNLIDKINELSAMDFKVFRLNFTDESANEINKILNSIENKITYNGNMKFTNGHYNRGVE